jgi:inhibitor of cysteine peptidase
VAGETASWTLVAYDAAGNFWDVTIDGETSYSVSPGAQGQWGVNEDRNVYTSERAGTWAITGSYLGKSASGALIVLPNLAGVQRIALSPATATVMTGRTRAYTAVAYDAYGNGWTVTADATYGIDPEAGGSWGVGSACNIYTAQNMGSWTVTAGYGGRTGTATLNVTMPTTAIDHLVLAPATATVGAGETQAYTLTAYAAGGSSWPVTLETGTVYSISGGAGGSWGVGAQKNRYTAHTAGIWTVTATYSGKSANATLTVTPDSTAVDHVILAPATATVAVGQTQAYTLTAYDAYGNSWAATLAAGTTYSIDAGAGGSWGTAGTKNIYTAGNVGPWTVTGAYGGESATAGLTVQATPSTYTLSGLVRDNSARAIAGATVLACRTGYTQTATTNAAGQYTMELPAGTYAVYCIKQGIRFTISGGTATSANITLGPATTVNFIGRTATTYTIRGTITRSTGGTLAGITVALTNGTFRAAAVTNGSGVYEVPGLPAGTYTITPSDPGYVFSPLSRTIRPLLTITTANFTATPTL